MVEVFGRMVDSETRCTHYHTKNDIIAIKFYCCGKYYPCYKCHEETTNHKIKRWPKNEWDTKAILCGACVHEMSIHDYMKHQRCLKCEAGFNPNCSFHYHLYFEMND